MTRAGSAPRISPRREERRNGEEKDYKEMRSTKVEGQSIVAAVCRWDDRIYCKEDYEQGQLLLGKICIGQYSRWSPAALAKGGHDPARPIRAWACQANFIAGIFNDEPHGWFATEADARRFVEGFAVELINTIGRALHIPAA